MEDHDQRFKTLLREFFADFFRLFFPTWFARFDFANITWLDKEFFTDPPTGERGSVDLVCQLPTLEVVPGLRHGEEDGWIALVHIEIEQPDRAAPFHPRMFDYYVHLRRTYRRPVLPIAVFLQVGLEGIGIAAYEEHFWELRALRFEYHYVGLPALDADSYLNGDNWLGVALAALMRCSHERRAWLGAEAIKRVTGAPLSSRQKFLLFECVQAYAPMDAQQNLDFDMLLTDSNKEPGPMYMTPVYHAQKKGQLRLLVMQLEKRFGPLREEARARLEDWPPQRLDELALAMLDGKSLQELGLED